MFLYKNFNILNLIQFYLDAGSGRELGQLQLPESVDVHSHKTKSRIQAGYEQRDDKILCPQWRRGKGHQGEECKFESTRLQEEPSSVLLNINK